MGDGDLAWAQNALGKIVERRGDSVHPRSVERVSERVVIKVLKLEGRFVFVCVGGKIIQRYVYLRVKGIYFILFLFYFSF